MTKLISVGQAVRASGETGSILRKWSEYHQGRDEFVTLISIVWDDGHQTQHLLEEFKKYGGGIELI
jgi:hypothetical protein